MCPENMGSSVWERLLQMPQIKMQQQRKMEIILTHVTTAWAGIWSRKFSQPT